MTACLYFRRVAAVRTRMMGILVGLALGATGLSAQFYANLDQEQRRELGEAYYLAGSRYQQVGAAKGSGFIDLAYQIYPALDPSGIVEEELPALEELLARGPLQFLSGDTGAAEEELIRSRFLRLAGAFLTEDASGVVRGLAGSILLTPQNTEVSQREAHTQLVALFESVNLGGMRLTDIYDLDSVTVTAVEPAPPRLGPSYRLRIRAVADLRRYVGFWADHQTFVMSRGAGNQWLVTAIGSALPAATWSPRQPDASVTARGVDQGAVRRLLEGAFANTVAAFVDKDADGLIRHLSDQVTLTREDRSVVERDTVRELAQQHFASSPYVALRPKDVAAVDSVEVASRDEEIFVLTATFSDAARAALPEWTAYQQFFFAREGSLWKVFAIS